MEIPVQIFLEGDEIRLRAVLNNELIQEFAQHTTPPLKSIDIKRISEILQSLLNETISIGALLDDFLADEAEEK
jgi:type III secretory pathway component EscV